MQAEELIAMIRKEPFHPIQITMNDGTVHVINYPTMAVVARKEITLGIPAPGSNGRWATGVIDIEWTDVASFERLTPSETTA